LALRQIAQPEIAVLLKGDWVARGGSCGELRCRALCGCRQMPPDRRNQGGNCDR
jgi:hypothetical protein